MEMSCSVAFVLLVCSATFVSGGFGPMFKATQGEVWPKPRQQVYYDGYLVVRPSVFTFKVVGKTCDLLQEAAKRYSASIRAHVATSYSRGDDDAGVNSKQVWKSDPQYVGYLDAVNINLIAACEDKPSADMDEHYELRVNSPDLNQAALLTSQSIWGILRGLETFSQILYLDESGDALRVNSTAIMDFPRFKHRGLLLDTARHYQPLYIIRTMLDAMEMNKMNVFHWHIVDDQSFPYVSKVFPELSEKGAYHPKMIYTQSDIKNITEYARLRGIRVMAELDTPGHTLSWGQSHPNLLTPCYKNNTLDGTYGPLNPILNSTYTFIRSLFKEVVSLFPDEYLHLGGDEVSFACWESNPEIKEFMRANNLNDSKQLEQYYMQRVVNITKDLGAQSIVWQEVFENNVAIPEKTVVHIWSGNQSESLHQVTKAGHPALLSACWYLDHFGFWAGGDWFKYYNCEPTDFNGTAEQKSLVVGGEACMWGETVDQSNIVARVWPRASAAAEKLWSSAGADTQEGATYRLEEHYCRMRRRGVGAEPPTGPGYCLY